MTPLCRVFFAITQKVFVWGGSNFLTFLTITCPLLKSKSWVFIPAALSRQACMLFQTKFKFRPTSSHWISTFYRSSESLQHKEADCSISAKKFCVDFCTDAFRFEKFCKYLSYFNLLNQRLLKNVWFFIVCTLFVFARFR